MPDGTPQQPTQQAPQAPAIDFTGLRTRTVEQAQGELPQPQYMAPGEGLVEETKLGKAYQGLKDWLGQHEEHLSEEYLKPIREHLDNMGEDLQQAAETGHTKTGGQLTPVTRLLLGGVGTLMKAAPVGKDVPETIQMAATPPELGPEGRELAVAEKAEQGAARTLPFKGITGPPPEQARLMSEYKKQVAAATTVEEKTQALQRLKSVSGTQAGMDIAKSGGEQMAKDIRAARAGASPKTDIKLSKDSMGIQWAESPSIKSPEGKPYKVSIPKSIQPADVEGYATRKLNEQAALHSKVPGTAKQTTKAPAPAQSDKSNLQLKRETRDRAQRIRDARLNPTAYGAQEVNEKGAKALGKGKEPRNASRIVVEGVDEPAKGKFSDRVKIDPFTPSYLGKRITPKTTVKT